MTIHSCSECGAGIDGLHAAHCSRREPPAPPSDEDYGDRQPDEPKIQIGPLDIS